MLMIGSIKRIFPMNKIKVGVSPSLGIRGVIATEMIRPGEVIEEAPVIIIPKNEYDLIERTVISDYYYEWEGYVSALALGCGSLYNHSFVPNAVYERDMERILIVYKAIREIKPGEEVTINYNGVPNDDTPIEWLNFDKDQKEFIQMTKSQKTDNNQKE